MNKKGFTLIELIAVVVIMAIIALIATPNIVNLVETSKKSQYVADAKNFISRVKSMDASLKYKNNEDYFINDIETGTKKICLEKIVNVESFESPFDATYIDENSSSTGCAQSYVSISEQAPGGSNIKTKVFSIYLTDGKYAIGTVGMPIPESEINKDKVKKIES